MTTQFSAQQVLKGAALWAAYMDSVEGNRRPWNLWVNWRDANSDVSAKAMQMAEAAHAFAQSLNYPDLEAA